MIRRAGWSAMLAIALILVFTYSGCAWEKSEGQIDSGYDSDADTPVDEGSLYPPGPYGINFGDTVANFRVYKCLCSGGTGQGRAWDLAEHLGTKALLVTAHAGWCPSCKTQAQRMVPDFYDVYRDQGFDILLIVTQDADYNSSRQAVLDFCCEYKEEHGFEFVVAADPDSNVVEEYMRSGVPLNMLLDEKMVIRYREEGYNPDMIGATIEKLLAEE